MTASFIAVSGMPEIRRGDRIVPLLFSSLKTQKIRMRNDDIVVIAHKVVSKSLGLRVKLAEVKPGARAKRIARQLTKDPSKVEVVLRESRRIIRMKKGLGRPEGLIICEHISGHICANAGVDESNAGEDGSVILLPRDPDREAARLRRAIERRCGKRIGVVVSDTFGRPWRVGLVNVAIGVAGINAVMDLRGKRDASGKLLRSTILGIADEIAAAAGLFMGKTRGVPAVIVRGLRLPGNGKASELVRKRRDDLFR